LFCKKKAKKKKKNLKIYSLIILDIYLNLF